MKIITWNVNGIRAVERKKELQKLIETQNPEILCLQETKAKPEQLSKFLTENETYTQFYHSAEKAGYSGTSIWIKKNIGSSFQFITDMAGNPVSEEGRVARIDFEKENKKFSILGVYFPNGGKSPLAWKQKLVFYEKFLEYVNQLRKEGKTVIWCGDVNCAHEEIDLARPKDNLKSIGFLPEERAWIFKCIEQKWVDVWRKTNPEKTEIYSWWHVITRARLRNVGWRIDYFFCDESLFSQVKNIEYLNDQMGSDHCPVLLEI